MRAYFGESNRRSLIVAAAGFDPRSLVFPMLLAGVSNGNGKAIGIREERPAPVTELARAGDGHQAQLESLFPGMTTFRLDVFADDLAVIGGREIVKRLATINLEGITDVVLDVSALSMGIYYPAFAYLLEKTREKKVNFHLVLASSSKHDGSVARSFSDKVASPHGLSFNFDVSVARGAKEGRLWLPQLAHGARPILDRIHGAVGPDDVCPILPFPSSDARAADDLASAYMNEFGVPNWSVDSRGILLSSDSNPLDTYRSLVRLHAARKPVFGDNPSSMILTPIGSKAPAVGMLLAAMELSLPVVSVEVLAYSWKPIEPVVPHLLHLWINQFV
jgi:hypothetical protein